MNKLNKLKQQKLPITCLTAYSYPIAKILDKYCDVILVGDSVGMTIYGMENTRDVTLDMMINHGKAVTKATKNAFIIVDMPFGSYESSPKNALKNAQKIIDDTGCDAIKIETTKDLIPTVKFLVKNNIPTIGHVGLLPQKIRKISDYKYQGKDKESAADILKTAIELEKAGISALIIEAVPATLASQINQNIKIPTIGIGASPDCSGQILVIDDILGLNQDFKPKFVKQYDNIANKIEKSVEAFCQDIQNRKFPNKENLV